METSEYVARLIASLPEDLGLDWQNAPDGKPLCLLCVGSPGAGKTAFLADNVKVYDGVLVSQDVFRELLPADLDAEAMYVETKAVANEFLAWLLCECRSVMVEATGTNFEACKDILDRAKAQGYTTYVVWVKAGLNRCLLRNERRQHPLPDDVVIQKWYASQRHAPTLGYLADEYEEADNYEDRN